MSKTPIVTLDDLAAVARDLDTAGADWMLVGALARDALLHEGGEEDAIRTNDADAAVNVATWQDYRDLKSRLVVLGWTETRVDHRMHTPHRVLVDLVPFGRLEAPPGSVPLGEGNRRMNVLGYEAALRAAEPMKVQGHSVKRISLPFFVLLKCFAWEDRQDRTAKDAEDLNRIFRMFDQQWMDRDEGALVIAHADVFDLHEHTYEHSARVLGRIVREAAAPDGALVAAVEEWLDSQRENGFKYLALAMGSITSTPEKREQIWEAFAIGWQDVGY